MVSDGIHTAATHRRRHLEKPIVRTSGGAFYQLCAQGRKTICESQGEICAPERELKPRNDNESEVAVGRDVRSWL